MRTHVVVTNSNRSESVYSLLSSAVLIALPCVIADGTLGYVMAPAGEIGRRFIKICNATVVYWKN